MVKGNVEHIVLCIGVCADKEINVRLKENSLVGMMLIIFAHLWE